MFLLALLLSCRCAPPAPEPPEEHFSAAEEALEAALVGGDVAAAARGIEAPGEGEASGDVHAAAGFLQVAEGPEELAEGLTELALACGRCHVEAEVPLEGAAAPGGLDTLEVERAWWAVAFGRADGGPALVTALQAEIEAAGPR